MARRAGPGDRPDAVTAAPARAGRAAARLRVVAGSVAAAVLGAAPHVLHHAGPLAGAALFAGAGGTLLFGAAGLAASAPMLWKIHARTGSWWAPGAALALFATLFALSSFVVGPTLTGGDDDGRSATSDPGAGANPPGVERLDPGATAQAPAEADHDGHHP